MMPYTGSCSAVWIVVWHKKRGDRVIVYGSWRIFYFLASSVPKQTQAPNCMQENRMVPAYLHKGMSKNIKVTVV